MFGRERKPKAESSTPENEQGPTFDQELELFVESDALEKELATRATLTEKQKALEELIKRLPFDKLKPILWKTLVGRLPDPSENVEVVRDELNEKLYNTLLDRLHAKGKL